MTAPKARNDHTREVHRPQNTPCTKGEPANWGEYRGGNKSGLTVADWADVKRIYRSTRAKHKNLLERLAE